MKINKREKKFIVAALVSAVVFAVLQFGNFSWLGRWASSDKKLAMAQKKLKREKELVAAAGQVQAQVATLESQLQQEESRLLPAPDSNQAGAQLQEWLSQKATEQKLDMLRSDFLATSLLNENYLRVPVRVELVGRISQLVQFFAAVTQGERIAALEDLQISNSGPDKEKRVRCVVVVAALAANPAPASASKEASCASCGGR